MAGKIQEIFIGEGEFQHIAHSHFAAVLHIHDTMVGRCADDLESRRTGQQCLYRSHIGSAEAQQCPAAYAPVNIGGTVAKGVQGDFPLGIGGLHLDFQHLRPKRPDPSSK